MEIGQRIRDLRREKKVTLVELSQKTGVAQATLSRIETGVMTGTLESHQKVAQALGMSVAELYAGMDDRLATIDYSADTEPKITVHNGEVTCEALTQQSRKKKITPLRYTLQPGSSTEREKADPGVEKFLIVLSGSVRVTIEKKAYSLSSGQTIYFDASLTHMVTNSAESPAVYLTAASQPA